MKPGATAGRLLANSDVSVSGRNHQTPRSIGGRRRPLVLSRCLVGELQSGRQWRQVSRRTRAPVMHWIEDRQFDVKVAVDGISREALINAYAPQLAVHCGF
jgi:hypothetical protein